MTNQFYKSIMKEPGFLPLFEEISSTYIKLYADLMLRIKQTTGQKDEQALQATTFTLWKATLDRINSNRGSIVLKEENDLETNLRNFDFWKEHYPQDTRVIFAQMLLSEYGDLVSQDLLEKLLKFLGDDFDKVSDYYSLATLIISRAALDKGNINDAEYEGIKTNMWARMFPDK